MVDSAGGHPDRLSGAVGACLPAARAPTGTAGAARGGRAPPPTLAGRGAATRTTHQFPALGDCRLDDLSHNSARRPPESTGSICAGTCALADRTDLQAVEEPGHD